MIRHLFSLVLGTSAGAIFGAAFGCFASLFRGGPAALQGALESAPFFAAAFALAALTISFERERKRSSAA